MPRYVLTTQSLIDIARKQNLPAEIWLEGASSRGVYSDDLFLSAATPARVRLVLQHARQSIASGTASPDLTQDYISTIEKNADQLLNIIKDGGHLIPADEAILTRWADLLNDPGMIRMRNGQQQKIESIELLEIATAAAGYNGRAYRLLAENEPHLQRVNGLIVEAPSSVQAGSGRP